MTITKNLMFLKLDLPNLNELHLCNKLCKYEIKKNEYKNCINLFNNNSLKLRKIIIEDEDIKNLNSIIFKCKKLKTIGIISNPKLKLDLNIVELINIIENNGIKNIELNNFNEKYIRSLNSVSINIILKKEKSSIKYIKKYDKVKFK